MRPKQKIICGHVSHLDDQMVSAAMHTKFDDPNTYNYHLFIKVNNQQVFDRDCALIHRTHALTCNYMNGGVAPEFCELCSSDECNVTGGVAKALAAISLIFASLLISLRLH